MEILVYIDETGSVLEPSHQGHYGVGFIFFPESNIASIESCITQASLNTIHVKALDIPSKIKTAENIGTCKLEQFNLRGGAVIRTQADFAQKFSEDYLNDFAIRFPELTVQALNQKKGASNLKRQPIVTPHEVFDSVVDNSRVMEIGILATRYSLYKIIQEYGHLGNLRIKFRFGAVGDQADYRLRLAGYMADFPSLIREYLQRAHHSKAFPRDLSNQVSVEWDVFPASGIFGLADFFASIGHFYAREAQNPANPSIADALYKPVSGLLPIGPNHKQEVRKGIFFV